MTFAEAKDKVAREYTGSPKLKTPYRDWEQLHKVMCRPNFRVALDKLIDRAAELYAASVREEAEKGYKEILSLEEPNNKHGMNDWDRGYLKGIEDAQDIAKEAIEKLTDPGR